MSTEAMPATSHDAESPGPKRKSGKFKWIAAIMAALMLFGGGIGAGTAMADPTTSDEYALLAADKAAVEEERDGLQEDYDGLKGEYDTLSDGIADREAETEEREDAVKVAEDKVKKREDDVKKREDAVSGAEKKKAENTVRDGTWTVGRDIAPGTYRTTNDVGSRCYWGIYTSGTNGDDIINNDIPGGGRPTVTISEGQDFKTSNCGTWEIQ